MAEQTQDSNALMSSFGLDMSNLLPKSSGKKPSATEDALGQVMRARANFAAQEAQFEGQQALSKAEIEKRTQKKISNAASAYAKTGKDAEELKRIDELEKKSLNEFVPTKENAQDLSTLFGLTTLIGFALGGVGKKHAMQAMSAMNGMLEGHRLGREDLYKKEKDAYEVNQKALKTQIDMLTNRFKMRMEQGARDLAAATEDAKGDALEAGALFIAQHVSQFGLKKTSEYLNGLQNVLIERQKREDSLAEKAQARNEKAQERAKEVSSTFIGSDNKMYVQYKDGRIEEAKIPAGVTLSKPGASGKAGGGAGAAMERVMQQDIGNAVFNLQDLKALGEKSGKLPGGSVAFANKFTGDISSMIQRYIVNQTVDEDLQGVDALMLNLAFDIASAQQGGRGNLSDAKVRAVVQQMPLSEQSEATKATKWAAVLNRVEEANKSMPEGKKVVIPEEVAKYFGAGRPSQQSSQQGPQEGQEAVSKSGKPMVFRNGQWEYKYASTFN
jgi:hypothetical protein